MNLLYEISKVLLAVLVAYISHFYYKYFTRENPLPGPFPLPFIGSTHLVFKKFSLDLRDVRKKYGDICDLYMGSQRYIMLSNDEITQKILKPIIDGPFHKRANDDEGLKEIGVYNSGLFFNNENYADWQYFRRFYTKVMMSPSFIKQSVIAVQDNFIEMEKYWEKLGDDTVLEFNHWMKRYFFDTIFVTTISKPAYALANYFNKVAANEISKSTVPESILKESNTFIHAAEVYVNALSYFMLAPKVVRDFPGIKKYTDYCKETIEWYRNSILNIVKLRRDEISKTPIDQKIKPDMLTMFLTVNTERDITERIADDLHDMPMSDFDAVSNFMEIMSAGIDTSSTSMCFLVYFLENTPKAKQRMIEEIERVIGKDINSKLKIEDLSKLEYVEAVIKESARLRSVIPAIFKKNSVPEEVAGYNWSKDTYFILDYDGIHYNKSYWKDPEVFNPDRFMDDPESKNKLYMFGGGLRKCPGRNLAMMEIKATLSMLYRKYDIELIGTMKEHMGTPRNCDELNIKLKKRKAL